MIKNIKSGYIEIIIAATLWGSSGILVKILALPATTISFFRLLFPTIILGGYLLYKKTKLFRGNNKVVLVSSALTALRIYLYTIAFLFTSVGNAVIIHYTWPIFAVLFSIIILKEKVNLRTLCLIALSFLGAVLIYANKQFSLESKDFIGMVAVTLEAIIMGFTTTILKPGLERYSKYETVFYYNFLGAIIFLPFVFINKPFPTVNQMLLGTAFSIVIGLVGYVLFFSALKEIGVIKTSLLSYLEMVSAIALAAIILGEAVTWNMVLGGSLVIFSALGITKSKEKG